MKAADTYSIYVDSELLGAPIRSNNVSFQLDVAPSHTWGSAIRSASSTRTQGQLDRVRIYGSALSLTASLLYTIKNIDRDPTVRPYRRTDSPWRDPRRQRPKGLSELPSANRAAVPQCIPKREFSNRSIPLGRPRFPTTTMDGLTSLAEQNVTFTNPAIQTATAIDYPMVGSLLRPRPARSFRWRDQHRYGWRRAQQSRRVHEWDKSNLPDSDGDLVNEVPEIARAAIE